MEKEFSFYEIRPQENQEIYVKFIDKEEWFPGIYYDDGIDGIVLDEETNEFLEVDEIGKLYSMETKKIIFRKDFI